MAILRHRCSPWCALHFWPCMWPDNIIPAYWGETCLIRVASEYFAFLWGISVGRHTSVPPSCKLGVKAMILLFQGSGHGQRMPCSICWDVQTVGTFQLWSIFTAVAVKMLLSYPIELLCKGKQNFQEFALSS